MFWGKLSPRGGAPEHWHPCADHMVDVGCVARLLCDQPSWVLRLGRMGVPCATPGERDALALIVGLHDLGKLSFGFQRARSGQRPVSHVDAGLQVVAARTREAPELVRALRERLAAVVPERLWPWLAAAVCHHGRPLVPSSPFGEAWAGGEVPLDPVAELDSCISALVRAFPEAPARLASLEVPAGGRGVSDPAHPICGLSVLSDWIGSSVEWFPYRGDAGEDRVALARAAARDALQSLGLVATEAVVQPSFHALYPSFTPAPLQRLADGASLPDGPGVALFEAATGSGKTEAALTWFARLHAAGLVDGLYFALPMRTAAIQLHGRVSATMATLFGVEGPGTTLAVPSYYQVDDTIGHPIGGYDVQWERDPDRGRVWAAESPNKYLAAPLAVGTIDQVLLGALRTKWSHFRGVCALRKLLVVDEVHASDAYMARLLVEVVRRQVEAGGHVLLLSATLGSRLRDQLLQVGTPIRRQRRTDLPSALATRYPCAWIGDGREARCHPLEAGDSPKRVTMERVHGQTTDEVLGRAAEAALHGARVLIIRNTVKDATATLEGLETLLDTALLLDVAGIPVAHHSRFAPSDRRLLDQQLLSRLGRAESLASRRPVVAVTTQTAEQSLDLDADLLITDLCPIDVLLQRVGRLHRHEATRAPGFSAARCVVLCPEGDLVTAARARQQGLGSVYDDVPVLEATLRLVTERSEWVLPRDNRELVERATHPDVLAALAQECAGMEQAWLDGRGRTSAEKGEAARNLCAWTDPFEMDFPRPPPPTRLGDDAIRFRLEPSLPSPFDRTALNSLDVPRWMLGRDLPEDPELRVEGSLLTEPESGRRFTYDRLGLRPEEAHEAS